MPKDISNTSMLTPSDVAFTIDPSKPVLSHGRSMQAETSIVPHTHPRGQLLWPEKGVLRLTSKNSVWVVPTTHAMWIPSNLPHQANNETDTHTRNLYVDPSFKIRQHESSIVMVTMSQLMQEVVIRLTDDRYSLTPQQTKHLGLVAIDELETLLPFNNYIHSGRDPRLQRLISHIVQNPTQILSLPDLSSLAGASVRTIERLFKSETGMTFRQWRSRFRLMNSLAQLTQGNSSTSVAYELGYKSVSSFIAAFKAQFGCTPQEYIARK